LITENTKQRLRIAVRKRKQYSRGQHRKELQATYDKLLDELSRHYFGEACKGRMLFRQQMNKLDTKGLDERGIRIVEAIRDMQRNENMIFNKDYVDAHNDVANFLFNHVKSFLKALDS
jgi:hypothetical protein